MATIHRLPPRPEPDPPSRGGASHTRGMQGLRAALALRLGTMAAALRQGRKAYAVSLGLLGLASLWLLLDTLFVLHALSLAATVLAALSLAVGIVQMRLAMRVDFDAGLVDALAGYAHLLPEESTASRRLSADAELGALLDRSLDDLGLRGPSRPTGDWTARWHGMRRLLRMQFGCVALQAALLGAAWGLSAWQVAALG